MASDLLYLCLMTVVFLAISSIILHRLLISRHEYDIEEIVELSEPTPLVQKLVSQLPDSVILPQHSQNFKEGLNAYWAQQECEIIPACILRPRNVQELSIAVKILKAEFDERGNGQKKVGIFAIRGGGHSPVPGAASIEGGVVVDLRYLSSVTLSENEETVTIGGGAKWMDISKVLDKKGLAVVGGRNAAVGVGGLTLGGGISFFTPRFGLVCSNIVSYEVVLADGSIVAASANNNPDLWKAFKGGSNNFGIVTSFALKTFPCGDIWSGFLYYPAFQASKVITAFHETVNKMNNENFSHAAGPLTSFSYLPKLNLEVIAVNLVSTEVAENPKRWPPSWRATPFSSLWRYWSTCKARSLTNATAELNALNPPGRRQTFGTLTIRNDLATISTAHALFREAFASLRHVNPKGLLWTIVFQPLFPSWARKGDKNPLGLQDTSEPLVIVSFTVNWDTRLDDIFVKETARVTIEKIESFALANGTNHRFRYLNYCNEWQKPFEGYGEENRQFLKEISRKYDADGLFQKGCLGGFKLDVDC
ncbi:FAD-binding protein [Glarea lozoyensis ATCC 20868]|uniref:FAD-binding protein n=1 Tax=Glarea lozoyensis (strain ATCC 20868 / MF5171) TaxID=1116229 RepID=S3DG27_GLAL2|nr:FAD-binding protein [Glarea lozoyensis ATCC 20868]EPE30956.1 FAD-binding protein [Glarea lozoyensis ATCC 20868]